MILASSDGRKGFALRNGELHAIDDAGKIEKVVTPYILWDVQVAPHDDDDHSAARITVDLLPIRVGSAEKDG